MSRVLPIIPPGNVVPFAVVEVQPSVVADKTNNQCPPSSWIRTQGPSEEAVTTQVIVDMSLDEEDEGEVLLDIPSLNVDVDMSSKFKMEIIG